MKTSIIVFSGILLVGCGKPPSIPIAPSPIQPEVVVAATPSSATPTVPTQVQTGYVSVGMGATLGFGGTTLMTHDTIFTVPSTLPTQSICSADGSTATLTFGDIVCTYVPRSGKLYFGHSNCGNGAMPGTNIIVPAGSYISLSVISGSYQVSTSLMGAY